ncbi:MAG: tetratricopeptide repeat protein [Desulfobacteraceae bacterium]|nr:tetratricopeptide repeat protein [Desulfobacteraceae bacterium]
MTKNTPLSDPGNGFSSREVHFLKSDPEDEKPADFVPADYFTDRILSEPSWMKSFTDTLEKAEIPDNRFVCGVIQQHLSPNNPEDGTTVTEANGLLDASVKPGNGIWKRIDHENIAVALWDGDENASLGNLARLKECLAAELGIDATLGLALFPFMDFSRADTFYNAAKAVDHAAFFGPGSDARFDDVSLNISGDRLYQMGRTDDAIREYQRGLEINPDNTNLINSLGVCHGMANEPQKAKEVFKRAIEVNPAEVMAIYNMGLVCDILGNKKRAIQYLEQASRLDDAIFEVELTVGNLLFQEEKFDRALAHLARAKELNPKSGIPFKRMGEHYLEADRIDKAIVEFKRAIKLNPSDAASLSGLAHAFGLKEKNLEIAITLAKESIMLDPDTSLFRSRLGRLYQKTGQDDLARIEFDTATQQREADAPSTRDALEKRSA